MSSLVRDSAQRDSKSMYDAGGSSPMPPAWTLRSVSRAAVTGWSWADARGSSSSLLTTVRACCSSSMSQGARQHRAAELGLRELGVGHGAQLFS